MTTTDRPAAIYRDAEGYYRAPGPITAADYFTASARAGRSESPAILADLQAQGLIPAAVLPAVVADAWTDPDHPERAIPSDMWTAWFRAAGLCNEAGEPVERPAALQVFRGASRREAATGVYGMAWTTDRDQAAWFAYEHNRAMPDGVVYAATVPGAVLLADLRDGERGESEVVLDTRHPDWPTVSILPAPTVAVDA